MNPYVQCDVNHNLRDHRAGRPVGVRGDRGDRPAGPTESEVTQGDVQLVGMSPHSEPAPFGWVCPPEDTVGRSCRKAVPL